ncbi:unnamed protein product [Effrenium voratum]|uniref:Uncharacterized protein n=1 Tax=Effrenium voratum TaxID=2562239 RepID=A0AA36JEU4_9DINO|nr:unnamed protein product [Effrenium voratum]|mmetsp:Transcript_101119/g.241019  ORF Transcript_101119/g.241019 Transcript_101119/m.241019 type:complete len:316 (-) Transcript_101119:150-1097(-)|eukprot:CAMPEP_0181454306 /NCGR_PEP_ID=MMETSP1110-20121109/30170_1 /TAXON_ID=174948 /ORGANISM="Symbiodinium sp., Strain CCMP421" /LENGTH=315 /DNA_ID=CAMNT_0023578647 /DNA_START=55 /DNA_END=1002 /DNA_ORIENTATION=-
MHCISLLFALVALVQGDCESPETCAAQSSHAVAGSLIQHAHAASKEKARLGGYSVGHDNTQSCGVDRARIEDVADCRDAATALGLDFGAQGSYYAWPAFCFKYRERIYFNYDVAGSRSKSSAYMVCESMTTTTTTTTTTASEAGSTTFVGVRYELGAMGSPFCVEGEVIGTHGECASSAVATALGKSFINWAQTPDLPTGCYYDSSLDGLMFNYHQGGQALPEDSPVCKIDNTPVTHTFHQGELNSNSCSVGEQIDDPELCREAAAELGELFQTEGSYSGYPSGCFALGNGNIYYNRHEGNGSNSNARPICIAAV